MAPSRVTPRTPSPRSQTRRLRRIAIHNLALAASVKKNKKSKSFASTLLSLAQKIDEYVELHGDIGLKAELGNAVKVVRALYSKISWTRKIGKPKIFLSAAPTPAPVNLDLKKRVLRFVAPSTEDELNHDSDDSGRSASPLATKKARNMKGIVGKGKREKDIYSKICLAPKNTYNADTFVFVFSSQEDPDHAVDFPTQPQHFHVSYHKLISNSGFLCKILMMKHDGTLKDAQDDLIYDPEVTIAPKLRLNKLAIYMHNVRNSGFAKLAPGYHQISKLKTWSFWAGVKTFLTWVMHGHIKFGSKARDKDGALRVAAFLDVKMAYLEALKAGS